MDWPGDGTLIVTCGGGAEEALEAELAGLGIEVLSRDNGTVRVRGVADEMVRANTCARTASRVLVPVAEGAIGSYDELYRLARRVPWQRLISPRQTLAVSGVTRDRALSDSRLAALTVKDAVVDAQRTGSGGTRSSIDRRRPDVPISLFVGGGNAVISLDSSGGPLHERGYRREAGEAPLRETVAATMLRYAGYDGTTPLVDPFCGSGTIAIEAAMIAARVPPGALRTGFAFTHWGWLDRSGLAPPDTRAAHGSDADRAPSPMIVGRDTDERVLEVAARNAERAGVSHLVRFERADALTASPPVDAGLVVTNPPYGERMEIGAAGTFYRRLGENLKQNYPGWDVYLLSANRDAMKEIGLRVSSRRQLWNGGLDARLFEIKIFARE